MITVYSAQDAENEALFIADTIEKILRQYPDRRVAVLYRTNSQSRQIEEAMRRYNLKYNVVGGISYYQRAEVKDIIAYLKFAQCRRIRSVCSGLSTFLPVASVHDGGAGGEVRRRERPRPLGRDRAHAR